MNNKTIPVKFEDVLVGYTDQSMSTIVFLKSIPQKLKDLMSGNMPISISSRKIGEVDNKSGQIGNLKPMEMIIMDNKSNQ
jgi:hypothetical protein